LPALKDKRTLLPCHAINAVASRKKARSKYRLAKINLDSFSHMVWRFNGCFGGVKLQIFLNWQQPN
jgi:hypothetical protein